MNYPEHYTPGPATGAQVRKDGDKWTLILVRELRHSPERVWQALTDPAQLRGWAPFVVDGNLGTVGATVNLTWVENPTPQKTIVQRADAPKVLEYGDIRWELEPLGSGTRSDTVAQHRSPLHRVGSRGLAHQLRCPSAAPRG